MKIFILLWYLSTAIIVVLSSVGLVLSLLSLPYKYGAIITHNLECTNVGMEMLKRHGSVVDAIIAAAICESVISPHVFGIGGGFVASIYNRRLVEFKTLIARESAPAAAYDDMLIQLNTTAAHYCGVPGALLGYWEMHQHYGRLSWHELLSPSIRLCLEGFTVSSQLANAIKSNLVRIRKEPSMSELFIKEDGEAYERGDLMTRPKLGRTLLLIAVKGINTFYNDEWEGSVGQKFVQDVRTNGGILSFDDLRNYKVRWQHSNFVTTKLTNGYTLYTTPLPTSGALITFIMNVMTGIYTADRNIYWQRVVETYKHAFGLRNHLGDAQQDSLFGQSIYETNYKLQSDKFAETVRSLIHDNDTVQNYLYYGANVSSKMDESTVNIVAVSSSGDAVIMTSGFGKLFAASLRSTSTGIILNRQMANFDDRRYDKIDNLSSSYANYIRPGKMPMSSMSPCIVLDENFNVRLAIGATGGPKAITAIAQTIIKYLLLNETLASAVYSGRLHHQLRPMYLEYEHTVHRNTIDYLYKVGHKMIKVKSVARCSAIGLKNRHWEIVYDQRLRFT